MVLQTGNLFSDGACVVWLSDLGAVLGKIVKRQTDLQKVSKGIMIKMELWKSSVYAWNAGLLLCGLRIDRLTQNYFKDEIA